MPSCAHCESSPLDFVLSAHMQQRTGLHEDLWVPLEVLRSCSLECLAHVDSVLAFEERSDGSAVARVAITAARPGGGDREENLINIPDGVFRLQRLRESLAACMAQPGNTNWGTQTDVNSLGEALDMGIFLFRNHLPAQA